MRYYGGGGGEHHILIQSDQKGVLNGSGNGQGSASKC